MEKKFLNVMQEKKFVLVISPPCQSVEYIKAAIEGGADAVKLHCNVTNLASGNKFGSFTEEKPLLQEAVRLAGNDALIGLVPGADQDFISEDELREIEEMGVSFFSVYDKHAPPFLMESKILTKTIAIGHDYDSMLLEALNLDFDVDVIEASFMQASDYGAALNYQDILRYRYIAACLHQPVMVPSQKRIKPRDVRHLYEAGCKAVMIGAMAMDGQSPDACLRAAAAFREAIEKL